MMAVSHCEKLYHHLTRSQNRQYYIRFGGLS